MKSLVLIVAVLTSAKSSVVPIGVTVGLTPYSHPISSLYHSQDTLGQYAYGYATPTSTKSETKTADGVTQGGYSYIDSNGILQTVQYIADPVHGFRVAATNLPQDLPAVAIAKAQHYSEYARIATEHANAALVPPNPVQDLPEVAAAKAQHLAAVQASANLVAVVPQVPQDLPEVARARAEHLAIVAQTRARDAAAHLSPVVLNGNVVPIQVASYAPVASSQYHAQDGFGQYSYGYVSPLSSKSESKTADGVTRGGYSYIDANGVIQTVNYISDAVNGFRVAATNLPVGPSAAGGVVEKRVIAVPSALYTQEILY